MNVLERKENFSQGLKYYIMVTANIGTIWTTPA